MGMYALHNPQPAINEVKGQTYMNLASIHKSCRDVWKEILTYHYCNLTYYTITKLLGDGDHLKKSASITNTLQ